MSMYHWHTPAAAGQRKTPIRTMPVPSQSPATPMSPLRPNQRGPLLLASNVLLGPANHHWPRPVLGPVVTFRKTPSWLRLTPAPVPPPPPPPPGAAFPTCKLT